MTFRHHQKQKLEYVQMGQGPNCFYAVKSAFSFICQVTNGTADKSTYNSTQHKSRKQMRRRSYLDESKLSCFSNSLCSIFTFEHYIKRI